MLSRKEALALARRYRTCPPAGIRRDPDYQEQIRRHLDICPHCAAAAPGTRDAWDELAHQIGRQLPAGAEPAGKITPGGICSLKPQLARWRDGFYYNPCAVLVLEAVALPGGAFLVAQLYHDTILAGPGDLICPPEASSTTMLIECWHRYTLPAGYLLPTNLRVSARILDAVRRLAANPQDYPPWAPLPRPMAVHDARLAFRKLEVEVGYTFAAAGAQEIMAAADDVLQPWDHARVETLESEIKKLRSGVHWPDGVRSAAELLTRLRFAADDLPLAAADESGEMLWAAWVRIRDGAVTDVRPLRVQILSRRHEAAELLISGRVQQVPACPQTVRLLACLEKKTARPIWPRDIQWRHGEFRLRFESSGPLPGHLKIAVVCSTGMAL